ncbi:MAG: hypothetical protein LC664_10130, partial [Flavobacteriales bacterium]|nr:hypothetical protein [Flavobacteriales bacterium]
MKYKNEWFTKATQTFLLTILATVAIQAQNKLPKNFHYTTLDNGLELLVIEDQSVPLATIELAV